MLKAFEQLEKTVIRFLEREEERKSSSSASRGASGGASGGQAGVDNEEAAELIRRAIKRLKAL